MLSHREIHLIERIGWLRAAVLGANDGIVSTASLILGVVAASGSSGKALVAAVAGLVAGAMAMAAGEYVSVSSRSDTEKADLERERTELRKQPGHELEELAQIYVIRGLDYDPARKVAEQMTAKDALAAHARDELGILEHTAAKPVQAALTSAAMFAVGAALPLLSLVVAPAGHIVLFVGVASLVFLAILGAIGAKAGRAGLLVGTIRVTFWGAFAMAATAGIGALIGAPVG